MLENRKILPTIAEHAKIFGIIAKKNLGQNFLFDENLNDKIVRLAGNVKDQHVIEIGPGPGGLTRSILKCHPYKLTVIEKDERCIALLNEIKEIYPNLEIINGDALKLSIKDFGSKAKIISNLPYNIGTVLLFNWLKDLEFISDMTLMFQKEVAYRICAKENTNAYSRLSVMVQLHMQAEKVLDVSPQAFTPPPKVSSAIVKLTPHKTQYSPKLIETIQQLVDAGFNTRRKMINKSFIKVIKDPQIFDLVGLSPTLRAENLSLADYIKIAEAIHQ